METCQRCHKRATLKCKDCSRNWCTKCHEELGKPGLFAGKCGACDGIVVRIQNS